MIRPDFAKWNQSIEEIRHLSIEAAHARSRERFQALYIIGREEETASHWAQVIGRQKQTVLKWVHRYNDLGPSSVYYQASGGAQPKLSEAEKKDSGNGQRNGAV